MMSDDQLSLASLGDDDRWATYAWIGLGAYVFTIDVALGLADKKYMTDVFREALVHPIHKWVVIGAWAFTTKHLFFRNFFPKIDPYGAIAAAVFIVKRLFNGKESS